MKNFGVGSATGTATAPTIAGATNFGVTPTAPTDTTSDIQFTPGGARFTPFTAADFLDLDPNPELDEAMLEQQIQNDLQLIGLGDTPTDDFQPAELDITQLRDTEMFDKLNEFYEVELMRVDQVLGEAIGDNWQGSKTVGPMSLNVSDGLARRRMAGSFEDRQAYFKKHYPEGTYSRVPTGGGKFSEVYSIAQGGDVFNVDPTGFSDITNELGAFTGNILNFTTAGSLIGTLFGPLLGTAAGATLGNLIDQALVDETSMSMSEIMDNLSYGDAATIGLIDGVITRFLPIAAGKFRSAITGNEGGSLLAKEAAGEQALAAQQAAERLGLPLFGAAQLATENKLLQAAFTQTAGTSSIPGRLMNNQQRRLYEKLKERAASNFDSFTAEELSTYTKLQQDDLAEQVYSLLSARFGGKVPEGMTLESIQQNIQKSAANLRISHNELIDEAYRKAFNTADANNVVFDLTPLKDIARSIQLGAQTTKVPVGGRTPSGIPLDAKGKFTAETTQRMEGPLGGDLAAITNDILKVIDPTVSKISIKDNGKKVSFDALTQLKALRDRASGLMDGPDSKSAKLLVEKIDEILENPIGGGKDFLKYYNEAKDLVKLKVDTNQASNIASMFSRKSEVMPNELAEKFWTGDFTSKDWDFFTKMSKAAAGNKPEGKLAAAQLIADVQDGFITWLYQNPTKAPARIREISEADGDLFAKMVPDAGERAALQKITQEGAWLQSDGVTAAMRRRMTVGERALTSINEMTEAEIISFINKNGGVDGKVANDMRSAVFKKILDANSTFDKQGLNIVQPAPLAQAFTELTNFSGDYAKFRPLFQKAKLDGDIATYDKTASPYVKDLQDNQLYSAFLAGFQIDAGGQIQAASAVASLAQLKLDGYRTILTNNIMASVFANPPSVAQLKKLYGGKPGIQRFWNKRRANIFANILGQLGESFSKDVETPKEEVQRTGKAPALGDPLTPVRTSAPTVSASPPPPVVSAPPTLPPAAKTRRALNAGITSLDDQLQKSQAMQTRVANVLAQPQTQNTGTFRNLFPFDSIGQAIENSRLGQGIARLVR